MGRAVQVRRVRTEIQTRLKALVDLHYADGMVVKREHPPEQVHSSIRSWFKDAEDRLKAEVCHNGGYYTANLVHGRWTNMSTCQFKDNRSGTSPPPHRSNVWRRRWNA